MDTEKRREFLKACGLLTELSPTEDDDLYVNLDAPEKGGQDRPNAASDDDDSGGEETGVRGTTHGRSVIEDLAEVIAMSPETGTTQLFAGFVGCGKTTELKRLGAKLDDLEATHCIVWVPLKDHAPMGRELNVDDFLRAIAFELEKKAAELGVPLPEGEGYTDRLWVFLANAKLDFDDMAVEPANIIDAFQKNARFWEQARDIIERRFQVFIDLTNAVIQDTAERIKTTTGAAHLVVIIDDLEKMTSVAPQDKLDSVQTSVDRVFSEQSDWLQVPSCHSIHIVPFWLLCRNPNLGNEFNQQPVILPNIKVEDHRRTPPARSGAGIRCMEQVVRRRARRAKIEDIAEVFGPDLTTTLHPLIRLSGGNLRQLLVWVRDVLQFARAWPIKRTDTQHVVGQIIERYNRTLRTDDIRVLLDVDATKKVPVSTADLALFSQHHVRLLVLAYKNKSYWYDIHPVVRLCEAYEQERVRLQEKERGARPPGDE